MVWVVEYSSILSYILKIGSKTNDPRIEIQSMVNRKSDRANEL